MKDNVEEGEMDRHAATAAEGRDMPRYGLRADSGHKDDAVRGCEYGGGGRLGRAWTTGRENPNGEV